MKNLTGIVNNNGNHKHITVNDLNTKKEFIEELRDNGFKVIGVYTDEQIKNMKSLTEQEAIINKKNMTAYEYIVNCL